MEFATTSPSSAALPSEKGYELEKAPIRDCWFLVDEKTGNPAVSDKGTTAFSVERAIAFLKQLPERPEH
jgi:hypothetical protein